MGSRERAFTVLIVEDQALIALNIEEVARSIGACAVGHAARLSDALTLIETAAWDAALLDVKLARGDAVYPLAELLRAKGVPFAFLTAWDGELDVGYSDTPVLRKPFGEAELERCLRVLSLIGPVRRRRPEIGRRCSCLPRHSLSWEPAGNHKDAPSWWRADWRFRINPQACPTGDRDIRTREFHACAFSDVEFHY